MAGEASRNLIILGIDPDSSGAIAALQWHLPSSTQAGKPGQPGGSSGRTNALLRQSTAQVPDLASTSSGAATAALKGLDQPETNGSSGLAQLAEHSTQLSLQGATAEVMDIPCQLHKVGARSRRQGQHVTGLKPLHVRQAHCLSLCASLASGKLSMGQCSAQVMCGKASTDGCFFKSDSRRQASMAILWCSRVGGTAPTGCALAAHGSRCTLHAGNSALHYLDLLLECLDKATLPGRMGSALRFARMLPHKPGTYADCMQTGPQHTLGQATAQCLALTPV